MHHGKREGWLNLTEDEAIGLLEVMMNCPTDLDSGQQDAMLKLSEFCREFLRDSGDSEPGHTGSYSDQVSAFRAA